MRPSDRLSWTSPITILTLLVGVAIIFIGVRFLVAPLVGAEGYGVPVSSSEADAFLLAKGVRDIASGLFVFCLVAAASRRVVALFMLAATFIPVSDALIVWSKVGPLPMPLAIHGGTAVFMLILAFYLFRGDEARASA